MKESSVVEKRWGKQKGQDPAESPALALVKESRLELETTRELNNTGIESGEQSSERITVDVCLRKLVGDRKVASIQDIKRLSANLEASILCNTNVLDDRGVPLEIGWTTNEVTFHVAGLTGRHGEE